MELSKIQQRFINKKLNGYQLLKGKSNTGKSTASIYKVLDLENNYCLHKEDKILILNNNYKKIEENKELYNLKKNDREFYSLFSNNRNRVEMYTINDFTSFYFEGYKREQGIDFKNIDRTMMKQIVRELLSLSNLKKTKFIEKISVDFILDEIMWIKASAFTKDDYLSVERKGRIKRINKKSLSREYIYSIKDIYNQELKRKKYVDEFDNVLYAIEYAKKHRERFTHIIVGNCETLTRAELEFVNIIYAKENYSSLIFIQNNEMSNKNYVWLVKGRKVSSLGGDFKGKTFLFKNEIQLKRKSDEGIENFTYTNFKDKKTHKFIVDIASYNSELISEDNQIYVSSELCDVPVFNDIAAGSPIEINDNIEGTFAIPNSWLEKGKNSFILKVKGDSMIDKGIEDEDLVVIKQQSTSYNNDIVVANIEGEATLKILKLDGPSPILMPANKKYNPIEIKDKDLTILGIAIGVIKKR